MDLKEELDRIELANFSNVIISQRLLIGRRRLKSVSSLEHILGVDKLLDESEPSLDEL